MTERKASANAVALAFLVVYNFNFLNSEPWALLLGGLEEGLGFVEEEFGAAGLVEELEGAAGARDVLFHLDRVLRRR